MPAQSPTLSPTLSAMTAGLRGSSSGMPASTLPTRSAPTSAPLVKMPPPRRAKIEISEAPNDSATSASMIVRIGSVRRPSSQQDAVIAGDAEQAEPDHEHAGDGAGPEGDVERRLQAVARRFGRAHVRAHRDVHADIAGGTRQRRRRSRSRSRRAIPRIEQDDRHHDADDRDRRVLPVEIGLRAFLDRRRRSPACARCPPGPP